MVDVILERGPADKPFRGFMIQTQDEAGNVVGEFSNLDRHSNNKQENVLAKLRDWKLAT